MNFLATVQRVQTMTRHKFFGVGYWPKGQYAHRRALFRPMLRGLNTRNASRMACGFHVSDSVFGMFRYAAQFLREQVFNTLGYRNDVHRKELTF